MEKISQLLQKKGCKDFPNCIVSKLIIFQKKKIWQNQDTYIIDFTKQKFVMNLNFINSLKRILRNVIAYEKREWEQKKRKDKNL